MNTFRKELLLLLRDPSGLLLLIIMPALLLLIMTYVQDAPFKDFQEAHFDVLILNKDNGKVSQQLIDQLNNSKNFTTFDSVANNPTNDSNFQEALQQGTYKVGIIFPAKTTAIMVKATNKMADEISKAVGLPTLNSATDLDTASISILFDPALKPAMRSSISNALHQYLTQAKLTILIERLNKLGQNDAASEVDNKAIFDALSISESIQGSKATTSPRLNSVQHNVPAWAIFGMFMIVVPIAGNMLKEKNDGSELRVRLIPNAFLKVLLGKVFFYVSICLFQFVIMLLIGLYLLPLLDLPQLYMGVHTLAVIPLIVVIALAAVAFGVFIGSYFKTENQAMPFGAISNVIFAALGGIWVPLEILPDMMQKIAMISPLYWALEGINNIFLRDQSWSGILVSCSVLMGFSVVLLLLSYNKKRSALGIS